MKPSAKVGPFKKADSEQVVLETPDSMDSEWVKLEATKEANYYKIYAKSMTTN